MISIAGVVSIVLFYLLILGVGIWAGRKKEEGNDSEEEVMLAGRSIGLFVGIFTMTGMNIMFYNICLFFPGTQTSKSAKVHKPSVQSAKVVGDETFLGNILAFDAEIFLYVFIMDVIMYQQNSALLMFQIGHVRSWNILSFFLCTD